MSVANQLRQLLETHGDSAVAAARRSGVARETIRRILNGHKPPKLPLYLRKIALAYGLDERALLDGASPRGDFEWQIRHAPATQRLEWFLLSPAQRLKMTMHFLQAKYPTVIRAKVLAAGCGMSERQFLCLLRRWELHPPDRVVALELAEILHSLTGISRSWFVQGSLSPGWQEGSKFLTRVFPLAQPVWKQCAATVPSLLERMEVYWG